MRRIHKRPQEPLELLQFRKSGGPNLTYNAFPDKDSLRRPLLEDQGDICCYCMRRISRKNMKIEHYESQDKNPQRQLDWKNILAACEGGERSGERTPRSLHTCDTRKGNEKITIDPQTDNVEGLRYRVNGRIVSDVSTIQEDLDVRLNLNCDLLCRTREAALVAFKSELEKEFGHANTWTKKKLERKLKKLRQTKPYVEFIGLFEYWIEKKINQRKK